MDHYGALDKVNFSVSLKVVGYKLSPIVCASEIQKVLVGTSESVDLSSEFLCKKCII